jgi:hypothetical protein
MLTHAAVGMDSQHLQGRAAVGPTSLAGQAGATVEVGFDGDVIANLHPIDSLADGDDFGAEFVTEDAGVFEEGLPTAEGVQIRATDTDTMDPDQAVSGSGMGWFVGFGAGKLARSGKDEGFHLRSRFMSLR